MELHESDDPKSQLLKKYSKQREALKEEAKFISDRTEKAITNALVIGGALVVTYFLVRQFSGSKTKPKAKPGKLKVVTTTDEDVEDDVLKKQSSGVVSQIGMALASQATAFLLTLAKEKLFEYLEAQKKIKGDERS